MGCIQRGMHTSSTLTVCLTKMSLKLKVKQRFDISVPVGSSLYLYQSHRRWNQSFHALYVIRGLYLS